ncbi:hypothetical protein [Burkholderia ubonensis]|uniref:hypothetical protein n=1 Tax=Burkholderia ubonensis TaxID=101571 RepID=UPI000B0E7BC4|nr:hypothetical protein [Burkholderia ubonensis]
MRTGPRCPRIWAPRTISTPCGHTCTATTTGPRRTGSPRRPASRAALTWLPADDDTPAGWLPEVVGMGNKQRFVPPAPRAREKFGEPDEESDVARCQDDSVRGARGLTQWAIAQLLEVTPDLSEAVRCKRSSTSPHAFRHTVGPQMLAAGVALGQAQPN